MGLIKTAKDLIQREEVKEMSKDLISDLISGLLGDSMAIARAVKVIISSPFFIREQLFWQKFEYFLTGVDFYLGDKIKFSEKISEDSKSEENAKRIIHIIDRIEIDKKVDYVINATRELCMELITLDEYFRICRAIENCYISDLDFVKSNYNDSKLFPVNITIQDLTSNGLMWQAVIDGGSSDENYIPHTHKFTELALWVYEYALKFGED